MKNIFIRTDYLELKNLLKMTNTIQTGGEAKYYLQENYVLVNGEKDNRRGRKLYPGDQVEIEGNIYLICKNVG
jgi:S4 domain protein YaaA